MFTSRSKKWTKPFELLDVMSGLRRYMIYVRSDDDPGEKELGRGHGRRDPIGWKKFKSKPIEDIHPELFALMSDGKERTFNAICLELYGYTADAMGGSNIELAVWGQVYEGYLIHTFKAPVLFKQPDTLPLETNEVFGGALREEL